MIQPEVLIALNAGDYKAYDFIYSKLYKPLYGLIVRLTRSSDEAKDITQRVFIDLWERRETIDPDKNLQGYLYTLAKFYALNYFAHLKVEEKFLQYKVYRNEAMDHSADDIVIGRELEILIGITLEKMPKRRQQIMRMKIEEGMTNQQIAQALHLSPDTVKGHITIGKKEIENAVMLLCMLYSFC